MRLRATHHGAKCNSRAGSRHARRRCRNTTATAVVLQLLRCDGRAARAPLPLGRAWPARRRVRVGRDCPWGVGPGRSLGAGALGNGWERGAAAVRRSGPAAHPPWPHTPPRAPAGPPRRGLSRLPSGPAWRHTRRCCHTTATAVALRLLRCDGRTRLRSGGSLSGSRACALDPLGVGRAGRRAELVAAAATSTHARERARPRAPRRRAAPLPRAAPPGRGHRSGHAARAWEPTPAAATRVVGCTSSLQSTLLRVTVFQRFFP